MLTKLLKYICSKKPQVRFLVSEKAFLGSLNWGYSIHSLGDEYVMTWCLHRKYRLCGSRDNVFFSFASFADCKDATMNLCGGIISAKSQEDDQCINGEQFGASFKKYFFFIRPMKGWVRIDYDGANSFGERFPILFFEALAADLKGK